jgi:myo-inositol-1-phosphate synthase
MEQGLRGPLEAPSAYFMKSPPRQFTDHKAKEMLEEFVNCGVSIAGQ